MASSEIVSNSNLVRLIGDISFCMASARTGKVHLALDVSEVLTLVDLLRDAHALRAENARLLAMLREAGEALQGVIRVADRATVEFDAARSILSRIEEVPNG